jgi:hypothetical protein
MLGERLGLPGLAAASSLLEAGGLLLSLRGGRPGTWRGLPDFAEAVGFAMLTAVTRVCATR